MRHTSSVSFDSLSSSRGAALCFALASSVAVAAELPVCDSAGLEDALAQARAGDVVVLEPGVYPVTGLTCAATGTATQPIVVRARVPRSARILVSGHVGVLVSGDHWHFEDLRVEGVCPVDSDCDQGLSVLGEGFELRGSIIRDFDRGVRGAWRSLPDGGVLPAHRGLVERNDFDSSHFRVTTATLSQVSVAGGDDWVIRDNFIVGLSFAAPGTSTTYAVNVAAGGKRALLERNVVLCRAATYDPLVSEIGLGLGGGDVVGPPCAPVGVRCPADQTDAVVRNNIVVNCADVGIYVANSPATRVLYNTLIEQYRVDFRYPATTADATGNLLSSVLFAREGGTFTGSDNVANVALSTFDGYYAGWRAGDLRATGDVSSLRGLGAPRADVTDDVCGRPRPAGLRTIGAVEHSLGDCVTARRLSSPEDAGAPATCPSRAPVAYTVACGCSHPGPDTCGGLALVTAVAVARRRRRAGFALETRV